MYIFIINYVLEVAMGRYKIIKEVIKNQSNIEKKNEISELEFRKYRENNIKPELFIPLNVDNYFY